MSRVVAVETAGSAAQGIGHVMRSIAFVEALAHQQVPVRLTIDAPPHPLITTMLRRTGVRATASRPARADVIVFDRPDTSVSLLSDTHTRVPGAALVALDYYGPSTPGLVLAVNLNEGRDTGAVARTHLCRTGLRYATLRPSFSVHRRLRHRTGPVRRVFVNFGGTDPHGWSLAALVAVLPALPEEASVDLVIGRSLAATSALGRFVNGTQSRVRVHVALADPAPVLAASDMAVIGGGTMLIEAACLGVPAVVVPRTVEERQFVRQFEAAGSAVALDSRRGFPARAIVAPVRNLCRDVEIRANMRRAGRHLVDGRGAQRIARFVATLARRAA